VDLAAELGPEGIILINLSGRGDKDVETAARWFGLFDPTSPTGAGPGAS
jgi:tryptophan synthase beta chain